MSSTIMNLFSLSEGAIKSIDKTLESLSAQGVTVNEEHTGEMNFNGCASGYCQAWD